MNAEITTGDIIKLLLDKHNISIKKLSEISGVPIQSLYTLRSKDTRGGSIDTFNKICRALNEPIQIFTEYDSTMISLHFNAQYYSSSRFLDEEDRLLLNELFTDYQKDINYLSAILRSMGEEKYTVNYLTDIYNGKIKIEQETFNFFTDIITKEIMITPKEWKELNKFRQLKPEQRKLIADMLKLCVDRNFYWHEYINSPILPPVTQSEE